MCNLSNYSVSALNIAAGKRAFQSSTYAVEYAYLANDGDYSTFCSGNDAVGGANWWAVDLIAAVVKYVILVSVVSTARVSHYLVDGSLQ